MKIEIVGIRNHKRLRMSDDRWEEEVEGDGDEEEDSEFVVMAAGWDGGKRGV